MRIRSLPVAALFSLCLPMCTVGQVYDPSDPRAANGPDAGPGETDKSDDPDTPAVERFTITATPPLTTAELGSTTSYVLEIESIGYLGSVDLEATGLPANWSASFSSNQVSLADGDSDVVFLELAVPTNGAAGLVSVDITGTGAVGVENAAVQLDVDNQVSIELPSGTSNGVHPFPAMTAINLGTTVVFRSTDATAHRIHATSDGAGFPHQGDQLSGGSTYAVTPSITGAFSYYCHIHGPGDGMGALAVTTP